MQGFSAQRLERFWFEMDILSEFGKRNRSCLLLANSSHDWDVAPEFCAENSMLFDQTLDT
jgi:hypothetical protein